MRVAILTGPCCSKLDFSTFFSLSIEVVVGKGEMLGSFETSSRIRAKIFCWMVGNQNISKGKITNDVVKSWEL